MIDAHRLARSTDPETSHLAAEHVVRTGVVSCQQAQVLAAVQQWPGSTSYELARHLQSERVMPARRLPELAEAERIFRGKPRTCSITRRLAMTWWPEPQQLELLENAA